MNCPHDTDGDGNCGNPRCIYCGRGSKAIWRNSIPLDALTELIDLRIRYWKDVWDKQRTARDHEAINQATNAAIAREMTPRECGGPINTGRQ
jgi:hypothetical protein